MKRLGIAVLALALVLALSIPAVAATMTSVQVGQNLYVARVTGAAAIDATLAPGRGWVLLGWRIHLSAAGGAGSMTVTLDSGQAAAYDALLRTQDMTAVTDISDTGSHYFASGDELNFAWANAGTKTYGLEVFWKYAQ